MVRGTSSAQDFARSGGLPVCKIRRTPIKSIDYGANLENCHAAGRQEAGSPRHTLTLSPRHRSGALERFPSVDASFQARENVGVVVARGRMLSSVRPLMRQEDSRRPVWEFADRVQITQSVLEAQWKALVVPAPSRRLLRHTLLPLTPTTSSRSWSV